MVEASVRRAARSRGAQAEWRAAQNDTTRQTMLLLAGLATMDGLVHVGAAVDHFGEFPLYTAVFASLAATQIVWAGLLLREPSRHPLLFGALFNLSVVGLWVASRTVGVPIAPHAWVPESIGVADLIETAGEIVVVLALWSVLMSERAGLARNVAGRIAPLLVLMLFLTALYGVGAHAG